MNKKKKPCIRFKGFTDDWEQRKLGELAQFNPPSDLPEEFEYVDLESVIGTEMVSHRKELKKSAPSRAQRLARKGDVFYQTVRPYQKNNYIFKKDDKNYVFSTGYAQLRPYINGDFLFTLVQTENFVSTVLDNCTGTSYPAINSNILADIKVSYIESEDEQMRIGMLFKSLNNLITLHQRKCEKLKIIKKSMLENCFPKNGQKVPKIRFSGFTGDWEQRKVGEFLTVSKIPGHTGIDAKKLTVKLWGKGIIGKNDVFTGSENTKYYIRRAGQFMYGKLDFLHAAFGIVPEHLDTYESTLDSPAFDMHDIDSHFLLERVMQKNFYLHNGIIANGSRKAKRIHENIFLDMNLVVPSYIEQEKIGSIFRSLDDLITLHQSKLEKLQKIKKSMLERMFV